MLAIANDSALYLLEFVYRRGLEREIERLRTRTKSAIIPGRTPIIDSIDAELKAYFQGTLTHFKTPLFWLGSPFQKTVWEELMKIKPGQTCSYAEIARNIGMPKAFRAVANANGANQLAIVIPCHRVINTNGDIGGYGGGISRKSWLLNHEKRERL
jgi:AraC family transcriptional regulator of adaptative response/methylated-DNA-[protein]-cysteine methyltransferase